jgi:hypothetical protein
LECYYDTHKDMCNSKSSIIMRSLLFFSLSNLGGSKTLSHPLLIAYASLFGASIWKTSDLYERA